MLRTADTHTEYARGCGCYNECVESTRVIAGLDRGWLPQNSAPGHSLLRAMLMGRSIARSNGHVGELDYPDWPDWAAASKDDTFGHAFSAE